MIFLFVSVTVDSTIIPPGDDAYLEQAWELKESIRRQSGVLKQRRGFFVTAYRQAQSHIIFEPETDRLIGFACTREGGYLLFLAIAPAYQGKGFGRELVSAVASEHEVVTCHARVSNENALAFYDAMGFEIVRRVNRYYEDGGDAFYLRLGEHSSVRSKLVKLFS